MVTDPPTQTPTHPPTNRQVRLQYTVPQQRAVKVNVKVKVHTLDIAPLHNESLLQKRSGMVRVLKDFTVLPARSSTIGMSHTCLCLPSYNWYSFTDPGGMEG